MRIVGLRYEVQMIYPTCRLLCPTGIGFGRAIVTAPAFGSDKFGLFDDKSKAEAFAEYLGIHRTIINEVEVLPHTNGEPT